MDQCFGTDDVIVLKLVIEGNRYLRYWRKINWLSKPNNHDCYISYQDPFIDYLNMKTINLK